MYYNVTRNSYEYDFIYKLYRDDVRGDVMPKETFFNLPVEKRERVIDAALDEFATRPYHKARITAIADKAGIAKGSFYQYFEDKKDLFKHIMDLLVNKKLEYLNHDMMANMEKYSFFQLLRGIYLSAFRFARENHRMAAVGMMIVKDAELRNEICGEYEDESSNFYKKLLEVGLTKGELDPAIDLELIPKILTALNYSLGDIIYEDGEIDLGVLDDKDAIDGTMEIFDKMLYFIENGIKKRE